ncbi:CDP-alcohol phosphatidyltransferase family protein [Mucilaginibacter gossypii]|uniref:CDP-alcohol phosphatidyltransferase family protein n=1 Tax=Mucilaginibacter gossypii TaxID=551996 RepID=UPI001FB5AE15|nr:CDP-alcohol phosphatidyltransferase family protein [Mucilaginibacter gossypii]QTE40487.2 CDP-alcohol phosphatidyltransferase family protein [Mucilaginibacter gossypii]
MSNKVYRVVNLITFYRLVAAPLLLFLLLTGQFTVFKWLLALSFFTDAIDGWLARSFKVISLLGARIDSVADDLTILVAILGILLYRPGFLRGEWLLVGGMTLLYVMQNCMALIRYGKLTSFHAYAAKVAAVLQGVFLVLVFFLPEPVAFLFYLTAVLTIIDLAEEILLVLILPQWQANVKGLYWSSGRLKSAALEDKMEHDEDQGQDHGHQEQEGIRIYVSIYFSCFQ